MSMFSLDKFGYSARGTKVHLYWFMRNWWQSWPSVWVYVHVFVDRLHTCNVHMCMQAILHTCDTHYLLCLPSLFLLSLPLTSLPPSFLPLPHTYMYLSGDLSFRLSAINFYYVTVPCRESNHGRCQSIICNAIPIGFYSQCNTGPLQLNAIRVVSNMFAGLCMRLRINKVNKRGHFLYPIDLQSASSVSNARTRV